MEGKILIFSEITSSFETFLSDTIKLVSPNSIFEAGIVNDHCKTTAVKGQDDHIHATSSQKIPAKATWSH